MKGKIIISLFMMVIIGIPMILINLGALGNMAQVERAIQGETAVPDPIADAGIRVGDMFGRFVEGREIDALFDTENLARARHVIHKDVVAIEDVLLEGEARPEPEFERLWVLARANNRAMAECELLLATIAKLCGVSKSETDENDDGTFDVESMISYVPSYYMGEINVDGPKDIYTQRLRLPADRDEQTIPVSAIPERRKALYQAAQQACRELRRTTSNCVISRIEPFDYRNRDGETARYHLSIQLKYVGERVDGVDESLLGRFISDGSSSPADAEARAGAFGAITGILGGGEEEAKPSTNRPSVLRGGGGGQFQRPN